ncbi:hypothetical protein DFH06DRAFT_1044030 [Mycena polygramma]|nr:hypothetical protein DFH06DRAFT_1044030 [Mycena polygramma]
MSSLDTRFDAANDLTVAEISDYRSFFFPPSVWEATGEVYLSCDDAPAWMTACGYRLWQEHDPTKRLDRSFHPDNALLKDLRGYRDQIIGPAYLKHPFFGLERAKEWVLPAPFATYKQAMDEIQDLRGRARRRSPEGYRSSSCHSSPSDHSARRSVSLASQGRSSSAPSPSRSPSGSRSPSLVQSRSPSRSRSPSLPRSESIHRALAARLLSGSRAQSPQSRSGTSSPHSSRASSQSRESQSRESSPAQSTADSKKAPKRSHKGKGKARETDVDEAEKKVKITRELKVNGVTRLTEAPRTWTVPQDNTAYLLDLSESPDVLDEPRRPGVRKSVDAFIRDEDQDAWGGSTGSKNGDVWVHAFGEDRVRARRVHLRCQGVRTCEYVSEELFGDCERYEPDEVAMRDLWNHELDANEREAASAGSILSRFYQRVIKSKCDVECDGVPILVLRSKGPNQYGKIYFVGCSKWQRTQRWSHVYHTIPPNVDEDKFKYVLEHEGQLPEATPDVNATCSLTLHPRIKLKFCSYSHIIDNVIRPAQIIERSCPTELIIFIPVPPHAGAMYVWQPEFAFQAIVFLRFGHNHPAHPQAKPSTQDDRLLDAAMRALGSKHLSVRKLLTAQSTSTLYGGKRVGEVSPAYIDTRKIRKRIAAYQKIEYPHGKGFQGVLNHVEKVERPLPLKERYIHAATTKGDFDLVVTLNVQLVYLIHTVLSIVIDFTFKRVEGDMDEWVVSGFSDRFKRRITFARLYCNKKSEAAFHQLFHELFDAIHRVSGVKLKLRPFFPDGNCRIVMLDGEVAQALGLGSFLVTYNQPAISNIHTLDKIVLLLYVLKTCVVHFQRHIDELSRSNVSPDVIVRLKSILGLNSQEDIDAWHAFCAGQTNPKVEQWYLQKQRNPWYLPSVNAHLSKISRDDWNITPRTTNIAETSHASTNADTSTSLPLLPAILATQQRDKDEIDEIHQMAREGIMRKRWNGPSERELLSEQRAGWTARKRDERNDDLARYDALAQDREEGQEEWRFSLARGHALQEQIQLVQAELKADKRRTDLSEEIKTLRAAVEFEKEARRDWVVQRGQIDVEMKALRAGPLKGVQINRTRTGTEQTDNMIPGTESRSSLQVPDMDKPNDEPEQGLDEDMAQPDYFPSNPNDPIFDDLMPVDTALPPQVPAEHPAEPQFQWNTGVVLDPALEPNYRVLGGSDDFMASLPSNNGASADYVLSLPPPPPPSPPADQPTGTSGPSRARRRKRDPEVDPANEVEGKRSRTASRRARGEEILQDKIR